MADYYVRTDGDDDENTGEGGFEGGQCWATIQKAADTAVAGDRVFIAGNNGTYGSGEWTLSARIDFDINSGTYDNPIKFIATNGHVKINGNSAVTSCVFLNGRYFVFFLAEDKSTDRWELYGSTQNGLWVNSNWGGLVENMDCYSNGQNGFYIYYRMIGIVRDCRAWSNGNDGFKFEQSGVYGVGIYGCLAYSNTWNGFHLGNSVERIVGCIAHSNSKSGFYSYYAAGTFGFFERNISANNTLDGFELDVDYALPRFPAVYNNIFAHNGRYGINYPSDNYGDAFDLQNNCFYNNGAGDPGTDHVNNGSTGENAVTSDPEFTDPDNDDYTIDSGSPCYQAGFPNDSDISIGYYQPEKPEYADYIFKSPLIR